MQGQTNPVARGGQIIGSTVPKEAGDGQKKYGVGGFYSEPHFHDAIETNFIRFCPLNRRTSFSPDGRYQAAAGIAFIPGAVSAALALLPCP
jgi:hypothetical protein